MTQTRPPPPARTGHPWALEWASGRMGVALWCLVVWLATPAWAQPLGNVDASGQVVVERAVWADPTGEAKLEDALTQTFNPAPAIVARGYQAGATWLRVTVPATTERNLWATIQPLYLDEVELYSQSWRPDGTRSGWALRQEGDRFPFASKERHTLLYSLALDTSPTEPTVFYVRLRTTSTHALYVNVRTSTSALDVEGQTLLGLGLYLGVVLVLAWTSLVRFAITRDTLWALNVLLQSGTVVLTLFYLGLPAKYLLPHAPQGVDALTSSVLCGHLFVGILYYWRFAATFQAPRWVVWGYAVVLLALPWQLWLIGHDQARSALSLNSNLVLLSSLLGMGANWFFKIDDRRLRWTVRFTFTVQTVYLVVFILPLMGVGHMTWWHLYPALLINLFASVMQHMVLARRDQLALQAQQRLEQDMAATQHELRAKQLQLAESTSFLGMLLHELKNPLASVRLAALSLLRHNNPPHTPENARRLAHIQTAVDGMDAVLERCRQVDRLETGNWPSQRTPTDLVALLADTVDRQPGHERMQVQAPPTLVAEVEPDFFQTMVGNLLDNALGYSPSGSPVHVTLQELPASDIRPAHVRLTVRNRLGKAGLPDPQRLFDKYYRADGAHQRTGSGLGLYLVKSLAERGRGGIAYRTELDAEGRDGVVFELWLPCR